MRTRPIDLGPFRLDEPIGQGGMGTVWSAMHRPQGYPVAIKVVSRERLGQPRYAASFAREVRAVAAMSHPGIVVVFDQGTVTDDAADASDGELTAGSPYLVMERLVNGSLRENHPAGWAALRCALLELLDALAHAHARGLVHRDIKPSNVMLASERGGPSVKLVDFGIAHALEDIAAPAGASVSGTPHYMAPEQVRGELLELGPWTDLYAVGCLAYRMASGRPPYFERGLEMAEILLRHLEDPIPTLESRFPVPVGLARWLERLLAKEPADRFRRAADAIAELRLLGPAPEIEVAPAHSIAPDDTTMRDAVETLFTVPATSLAVAAVRVPNERSGRIEPAAAALPASWRHPDPPAPGARLVGAGLGLYGLRPIPMVNRERERDALWSSLATVHRERSPRVVMLRGEAGVGKSRLARWLTHRAHEVGAVEVLVATHGPSGGAADGIGPMLARSLGTRTLSRRRAVSRTLALVRDRGGSVDEAVALVELTHPAPQQDTAAQRIRLGSPRERYAAATRWLTLVSRERPVLLWLDDVQWGLEALGLAAHLGSIDAPVLVVMTAREQALSPLVAERLEALAAESTSEVIELGPLRDRDHERLVAQLLGLSGELAREVRERTSGNPLFAVQLVGDWVHRGVLELGTEGFRRRDGAPASIPDDIHALWLRRLAGVEPIGPLELAATLGRRVDLGEWERACAAASIEAPVALVDALVLRGLAIEEAGGFAFAHGMLVESLLRRAAEDGRDASLHGACAEALADDPSAAERRADHLEAAGQRDAAATALLDAIEARSHASDYDVALTMLSRRDGLLDQLGAPPGDPRRLRGAIWRATVLNRQGRPTEARPHVEAVLAAAADDPELLADATYQHATTEQMSGNVPEAIRLFERARARYSALEQARGVGRSEHGVAEMLKQAGRDEESIARYEAALLHYREAGDEFDRGRVLLGFSDVLLRHDRPRAMEVLAEAEAFVDRFGYRLGRAIVYLHQGLALRYDQDWDGAQDRFERCYEQLSAVGSTDAVVPLNHLGILHLFREDYAAARAQFEENYERLARTGRDGYLAFSHAQLLPCYAAFAQWARFDAHCAAAEATLARSGLVDMDLEWLLRLAARLADEREQPERAARARSLADDQRAALEAS